MGEDKKSHALPPPHSGVEWKGGDDGQETQRSREAVVGAAGDPVHGWNYGGRGGHREWDRAAVAATPSGKPGGRGLEGFGVSVVCGRACGGHAMLLPLLRCHSTPGA